MLEPELKEKSQVTFVCEIRKGTNNFRPAAELKVFIWTLQKKMQKRGIQDARGGRLQIWLNLSFCIS